MDAAPSAPAEGGWTRLGTGALPALTWTGKTGASLKVAEAATTSCTRAAQDAATLAREIAAAAADAGALGELPVLHVLARRRARASCAVAGLRVAALPLGEGTALAGAIASAESTYHALPGPPVSTPSGATDGGPPR